MSDLDLKALWQTPEETSAPAFDIEDIQRRAHQFERKIHRRNLAEWAASAFVLVWFGHLAVVAESTLIAVGNAMVALSAVGISVYLFAKGRVDKQVDPAASTQGFLQAHAESIQAQARLLRTVPLWYLGPMGVGLAVLMTGHFQLAGAGDWNFWVAVGVVAVVFAVVAWINHRAAVKLEQKADAILAQLR